MKKLIIALFIAAPAFFSFNNSKIYKSTETTELISTTLCPTDPDDDDWDEGNGFIILNLS